MVERYLMCRYELLTQQTFHKHYLLMPSKCSLPLSSGTLFRDKLMTGGFLGVLFMSFNCVFGSDFGATSIEMVEEEGGVGRRLGSCVL